MNTYPSLLLRNRDVVDGFVAFEEGQRIVFAGTTGRQGNPTILRSHTYSLFSPMPTLPQPHIHSFCVHSSLLHLSSFTSSPLISLLLLPSLQVVEVDKFCPEAWCVVGNCFSLQREPEAALKFFQRALQIDPTFTYAHTLCGHELANNEDLEKAVQSFRNSLLHDDRHYNAW